MVTDLRYALDRRQAVAALLEARGDALVVSGLGSTTYDVHAAGDHPGNFYLWGAMGGAAMIGLGLALAQPARRVLVITGDGEQLMGLGALATIGAVAKPPNLGIAVIDNGSYAETGMQRSHTGYGADLCAIARGCGFQKTFEAADLAAVAQLREVFQRGGGPILGVVRVSAHNPPRSLPSRDAVFLKNRFRAHLSLPQA
ncbi:MAG TPA: thiamine pyrophosphate-dependent enzyme [Burkholderiales bacterium]|jgi:thiamine pyrophosphate-dependent acetolactate synthase large subunit-like protein